MRRIPLILVFVALSGCAVPQARQFELGNQSRQQYDRDAYECERDARSMPNATACEQMTMFERCMMSKAYKPVNGTGAPMLCGH